MITIIVSPAASDTSGSGRQVIRSMARRKSSWGELHPELGLATVYRTLEIFETGDYYKLEYGDGQARFEFNDNVEEHYHHHDLSWLRQDQGSTMTSWRIWNVPSLNRPILYHRSLSRFFGYCSECRKSRQGERTP